MLRVAPLWLVLLACGCQPTPASKASSTGSSTLSAARLLPGQSSAVAEAAPTPALLLTAAPEEMPGLPLVVSTSNSEANTVAKLARAGAPRRFSVAFMGDSLTDYRSAGGGFIRYLKHQCPESQFDNYGIGGQMTNQMRRRFQADVLGPTKPKYTHVVIFGGVNDLYSNLTAHRTNARIEADLAQMYDWARAAGLATVALTVAPWGGMKRYFTPDRGENMLALNRWITSNVGTRVDAVIETGPLLSCGNPYELCAEHLPPFNDGIHFGKTAHELIGRALHETVFSPCL
jgi:lysophospholipase L1-like esterase